MHFVQAIILGALQGVTELFPVSSLGHSILLPYLFGWHIDEAADSFLVFLVATHLATSLVLLGFFWKEWIEVVKGIFRSLAEREISESDRYAKLGWFLVVATIPAGIIGLLFQDKLEALFATPLPVSIFLICNGVMLLCIERYLKGKKDGTSTYVDRGGISESGMSQISWSKSVAIGFGQCLALLPGFSRTGSTLGAGLLSGLNHEDAARFSFLLATPIILAAAVLKLPDLASSAVGATLPLVIAGFLSAAVAAYLSVRYLEKYFQTKRLTPFGWYCITVGIIALALFLK